MRRLLGSRSARRERGCLVVEGPRLLADAVDAGLAVEEVFAERAGIWPGATLVRPGTLDRLGDAVTSQGVLAVVRAPVTALRRVGPADSGLDERWRPSAVPLVFVLVDVADPGNLGTVLRSAEAAGADAVILAGRGADPMSPKVVRSSAGSLFRLPVATSDDVADVLAWLGEHGIATWATVLRDGTDLYRADLGVPSAVLFGSEAHGLPPAVVAGCSRRLSIPMAGPVESLNVAMAATVVAFEASRQRRVHEQGTPAAGGSGRADGGADGGAVDDEGGRADGPAGGIGRSDGHRAGSAP